MNRYEDAYQYAEMVIGRRLDRARARLERAAGPNPPPPPALATTTEQKHYAAGYYAALTAAYGDIVDALPPVEWFEEVTA